MKLFAGSYWIPFPSSEYGGNWIVVAKDKAQCIEILKAVYKSDKDAWDDNSQYNDRIPDVVDKAKQYDLVGDYTAGVVDMFTT
jgi:hypothetical protein